MKKRKGWLVFLVILLAFLLRILWLGKTELTGDEIDVGYHAYSLLKTGADYRGQLLPVYIHSFSEYRAPLLMYLTAPSVAVFGLTDLGVRFPSVVFGLASIIFTYLLVQKLTNNFRLAFFSSLIMAISPWHLFYSRISYEATLLLALILAGSFFYLEQKWLLSVILFGLSFYTYNTANIFVPFLLLVLLVTQPRPKMTKALVVALALFLIVFPLLFKTLTGTASERFRLISIFGNPKTIDQIVYQRTSGANSPVLERFFHNKLVGWGKELFANYLTSFSPQFLFLSGDPNPRHNIQNMGELYLVLAPLIFYGLIILWSSSEKKLRRFWLAWLFLAPIPSSLTVGGGDHATRLFLLLPALAILAGLGMERLSRKTNVIMVILLATSTLFWLHNYFVHYPKDSFKWHRYGFREAFVWLRGKTYSRLFINNAVEPALGRYLFWTKADPLLFRRNFSTDQEQENLLPGFSGFTLGQAIFGRIVTKDSVSWLKNNINPGDLYLAFQGDNGEVPGDWNWEKEPPEGLAVLKTVYDPWGQPIMYWVTKK